MELWVAVSQTGRVVVITMRGMQWLITKTKSRQDASQAGVVTDRAVLSTVYGHNPSIGQNLLGQKLGLNLPYDKKRTKTPRILWINFLSQNNYVICKQSHFSSRCLR